MFRKDHHLRISCSYRKLCAYLSMYGCCDKGKQVMSNLSVLFVGGKLFCYADLSTIHLLVPSSETDYLSLNRRVQVYRMFFRMRRQHAFELKKSLERATNELSACSRSSKSSRRSTNGDCKPWSRGDEAEPAPARGRGDLYGQESNRSSGEHQQGEKRQPYSLSPCGDEAEGEVRKKKRRFDALSTL